jgi:hypothetical protein
MENDWIETSNGNCILAGDGGVEATVYAAGSEWGANWNGAATLLRHRGNPCARSFYDDGSTQNRLNVTPHQVTLICGLRSIPQMSCGHRLGGQSQVLVR